MATNFQLVSHDSSVGTSGGSSSDSDDGCHSSVSKKIDLSYSNLDRRELEANLADVAERPDGGDGVQIMLLYNNRLDSLSLEIR
jgi:hypothetical protein